MLNKNIFTKLVIILIIINGLFLSKWIIEAGSTDAYAQEMNKTEIGRYHLQYIPTNDGSDPRYLLLDTSTGVFWEAKGFIENVDDFCIYSE